MTPEQLKTRYTALYDLMASSGETKNMHLFGSVMTDMMDILIQKMPAEAEEMIDRLESIKWNNYLTTREAEAIVAKMDPKAPWTRDAWKTAMDSFGLPIEEQPCYNRCALFVEMSKMYSDHGETIAKLKGIPLAANSEDIIRATHMLALNTLKDKDGVYNIRRYFSLV